LGFDFATGLELGAAAVKLQADLRCGNADDDTSSDSVFFLQLS
jgi:hypothetical protein